MHTLITGVTESGKTTCGMRLARLHRSQGYRVMVLTSLWEKWPADYQTRNQADFLKNFWASENCVIFIDEAGKTVGRYNEAMNETATTGRHHGHSVYYLVQDPMKIDYTIRRQCSQLISFAIDGISAQSLSREFLCPELLQACDLPQGSYLVVNRFGADGRRSFESGKLW